MTANPIKLTQMTKKGGCAAKIPAEELKKVLAGVSFPPKSDDVLIDGRNFDDAAVVKITNEIGLVQTLDFFTPIVDSPDIFGRIATANALSDVYAMGGIPQTALAILAYPLAALDSGTVSQILQGACDVLEKAKCNLVGGHSIDDDTLKFGLSVHGLVHPNKIWSNAGAKGGDDLILTKPLGTGTICAALKEGAVQEAEIKNVLYSMMQLNSMPSQMKDGLRVQISSATDITGFGLLGHSLQMARASCVKLELHMEKIPVFPQAKELLKQDFLTRAHTTNRKYVEKNVGIEKLDDLQKLILFDPQTSGGLLLAIDSQHSAEALNILKLDFPHAEVIGRVMAQEEGVQAPFVTVY